jgi:replicative DNA helicase
MKTDEGAVVGFFSLEMSSDQLAARVLADVSGIPSDKMRRGDLTPRDYEAIREAATSMEGIPLYIDDMGGISISQLAARARRLQRTSGLDLLIIDYLQLITPSGNKRHDGRVQEVTEITKSLKALAKELAIPIIALSQLSRAVEMREDKRPQLADLRESGSIEQDADVVLFIYREAYYLERLKPDEADPRFNDWKAQVDAKFNLAEVIISKQRHGPIGRVDVGFNPARVKFSNLDRSQRDRTPEFTGGKGFLPDGRE